MNNPENLLKEATNLLDNVKNSSDLEQVKTRYLGKNGVLTEMLKGLKNISSEERPLLGNQINKLKKILETEINCRRELILAKKMEEQLAGEALDVTLPSRGSGIGGLHPLTRTLERIKSLFSSIGFSVASGPEIETDFYNFTALNIPESHPARAMHDTFYIAEKENEHLLRTHTSPVQIRYMQNKNPPIRVIAPGRVYRCDSDVSHTPMFHQVEGLWIDENINFTALKGTLIDFIKQFSEHKKISTRFRPSFFPFTEPSAEMDISCVMCNGKGCRVCGHTGWVEVLGCGMVHPKVLQHVNIDCEKYIGFAFGMGVERLAMLKYGVNDIRMFFENDLRFLKQFN